MTGLPAAGFWRRQGAWWLDRVIGLAVWVLGAMWLVLGLWAVRGLPQELPGALVLLAGILALGVGLHCAYQVVFIGGCGQTPGQMACGIAIVRRDGRPAGHARAALRSLGGLLTVLTLGLGWLVAFFNRERLGLADLVAGTRVVRLRPTRSLPGEAGPASVPASVSGGGEPLTSA